MGLEFRISLAALLIGWAGPAAAERILVRTPVEVQNAVDRAKPGDEIVLASGVWRDAQLVLRGKGTAKAPIALVAEQKGKVVLSGRSSLRLAGEHLLVSGLVFRDGFAPNGEVVAFRGKQGEVASHSRVTEVIIDHFNNPVRSESDHWVALYGHHNRFDHSHLEGKGNQGATLVVIRDRGHGLENRHRIDHNYFGPRPPLGSNGGETIRIGTSHESLSDSFTVVEDNYFDRCDGEVEIVSVKSGANVVRRNVFFQSQGALTLRHGDGNVVEDNVFLGGSKPNTGGVRVINRDQTIRNNYMEGLRGGGFTSTLSVMNGVPNSPINRYHQVVGARIERNTVLDSWPIHLNAGADAERSAAPKDVLFARNLIVREGTEETFRVDGDISGMTFDGNVQTPVSHPRIVAGVERRPVRLQRAANGLLYPAGLEGIGASRALKPVAKAETGVAWYPKDRPEPALDSGRVTKLSPADDLAAAARGAAPGDILALSPGRYAVDETVVVDKPLTLVGDGSGAPSVEITFTRPTLFQLEDGGSLRLSRLSISGRDAPDVVGNAVVRTPPAGLIRAYALVIEESRITDLQVNGAFHVLATSKGGFARSVVVRDSQFERISGAVLKLDAETDELGLYSAERVEIRNSTFRSIGGEAVALYRGGTDESTLGPAIRVVGSQFVDVGRGPRNASKASVRLHGVQRAELTDNRFEDSAPLSIAHTTGEPTTILARNTRLRTPEPRLQELIAKGAFRAQLQDGLALPEARP